ncbi:MAG: hypothetical protein ACSHXZ_10890 [Gammaproteobacteria bacterium]
MRSVLSKLLIINVIALALSACGFVTGPVTQGVAYAGKGAVMGVDTGMVYGKVAVKKTKDTAIYVREEAKTGFKPIARESAPTGSLRPR